MLSFVAAFLLVATNPADSLEDSDDCQMFQELFSQEEAQEVDEIALEELFPEDIDPELGDEVAQ